MSNRRRPKNPISASLDELAGRRIPGGCDDCDAYQQVVPTEHGNLHNVHVFHDDWCPTLAKHNARWN